MKKIGLSIICIGVVLIMCLGAMCACNNNDAQFYDNANSMMKESFLQQYFPKNAIYIGNENFEKDVNAKNNYTFVIQEQSKCRDIFNDFGQDIDFEKKTVLIYVFTCYHMGYECKIKSLTVSENILNIDIRYKKPFKIAADDSSMPLQRVLVVVVDKIENLSKAEFFVEY